MSIVSKTVQSAKSVLRKVPGSGSIERLLEKTKAKTEGEFDVKNIAKLTESDKRTDQFSDNAPVQMTPEELEEICNISRLRNKHRCMANGQIPPMPEFAYAQAFVYQRKRYARYGAASNIEPGKLWPSESEVETAKELARLRYTVSVHDILNKVAAIKAEETEKEAAMRTRDAEIVAKISKMEQLKEKIYTDAVKLEQELNIAEEKRNKRIEQVKRFFQYTLDVKDPRFKEKMQEMIQSEKETHKKKVKDAKKLKKEELKAKQDADKAAAIKARREAKAKEDAESSDDE